MKTWILILFALLSNLVHADDRIALVVGNGSYKFNTTLSNPRNDATDIAAALKSSGFSVQLLLDATRADMEKAIRDFGTSLKTPTSTGLFYYSGHGAQFEGQNYILPVDADIQDADELRYKAVDVEGVLAKMRSAGNLMNIVVLDACRNNPFPGSTRSAERGLAITKIKVPESLIVFATDPGSVASDGSGRNSPFTEAFLSAMRIPEQDISQMMKRVTAAVRDATSGAQTPWISSNLTQNFYFIPSAASMPQTPITASPSSATPRGPSIIVSRPTGRISLSTLTAGKLFLDGDAMGDLPAGAEATLDGITVGDHALELRYGTGQKESRTISVTKDQNTKLAFVWKPQEIKRIPKIGDVFAGGIVFYVDASGGGLVAAQSDLTSAYAWGPFDWAFGKGIGGTRLEIGSGLENTNAIIAGSKGKPSAALLCRESRLGGFTDWFLPSIEELVLMQKNLVGKWGSTPPSGWYWSSSEYDAVGKDAFQHRLPDGYDSGRQLVSKNEKAKVRAVRAFLP